MSSQSKVLATKEPSYYYEAKDREEWVQAMQAEIDALERNDTWKVTSLPSHRKALGCKWVYKTKFKPNGDIERCKARLVVRGDKQIKGKDYKHTFSPVAKLTTVRVVLTLAVAKNWDVQQLNINNAFLHGYIEEEIYMKPPLGYENVKPGEVLRLKRSLYGLKQASRQWNKELSKFLVGFCFVQSHQDYSMFTHDSGGQFTVIVAYVDDLLIAGSDTSFISKVKQALHFSFTIKDLGQIKFFLGIEIFRSNVGIMLK